MAPPPELATIRLDSDDFGAMQDMRPWREAVARTILGLDFSAIDHHRFRAQMQATQLGGMMVSSTRITPAITVRDRELADRNADSYVFAIAEQGMLEAGQRGRQFNLQRGQATLLATDEIGTLTSPRGGAYFGLMLPKAALAARVREVDGRIMAPMQDTAPRLRLVRQYARLCVRSARNADAEVRSIMGAHLADLVALALESDMNGEDFAGQGSVEKSRLQIILAAIEEQIDDSSLSLARIALACGLSPRSVQLVFEKAGTSYSEVVLNLRLDRAHAMLCASPEVRIIDVALAAGFADVSYFNRRFRARFGDTPSGVRTGRTNGRAPE